MQALDVQERQATINKTGQTAMLEALTKNASPGVINALKFEPNEYGGQWKLDMPQAAPGALPQKGGTEWGESTFKEYGFEADNARIQELAAELKANNTNLSDNQALDKAKGIIEKRNAVLNTKAGADFNKVMEGSRSIEQMASTLEQAARVLTEDLGGVEGGIKSLASRIGFLSPEKQKAFKDLREVISGKVLQQRTVGSVSNWETEQWMKAAPSAWDKPETWLLMANKLKGIARADQEYADFLARVSEGRGNLARAKEIWNDYKNKIGLDELFNPNRTTDINSMLEDPSFSLKGYKPEGKTPAYDPAKEQRIRELEARIAAAKGARK